MSLINAQQTGLPIPPVPELPPIEPEDGVAAIQLEHPDHTDVKHVGGGHYTSKNPAGQVVVTGADVARKYAIKHLA